MVQTTLTQQTSVSLLRVFLLAALSVYHPRQVKLLPPFQRSYSGIDFCQEAIVLRHHHHGAEQLGVEETLDARDPVFAKRAFSQASISSQEKRWIVAIGKWRRERGTVKGAHAEFC